MLPGGPSVPVPDGASEVSTETAAGRDAARLLLIDPGGELAEQASVTVRRYEVSLPVDTVAEFYLADAEGWEHVHSTSFDPLRTAAPWGTAAAC